MVGPFLSVLLLGIVPVWGVSDPGIISARNLSVAPPVTASVTDALPRLLGGALSASGVVIIDLESGQTMYADGAEEQRPMASLTKLMTALLIVEHHKLDELVTIPAGIGGSPSPVANLRPGDEYTVSHLLTALLVHSANDVALALAIFHSGTEQAFVDAMNARAISLGLKDTEYVNPEGFDDPDQRSTPRDVALLSAFVLRSAAIAERLAMPSASIVSRSGTLLSFANTHQLVRGGSDVVAGKTGTTDAAGECLFSVVKGRDDREYAVVLLHSGDRYADMRRILSALRR